jgi:pimeloyl-ACP methyl ester carboxylesterase
MRPHPNNPKPKSTVGSPKSTVDLRSQPLIWVEKRSAKANFGCCPHVYSPITTRELWNAGQKPTEADQKTFTTTVDSGCDDYYELLQSFSFMSVSAKSFSAKRAIKLLLICVAIFYLGICVFMALIQRSLLYLPRVYDSARVDQRAKSEGLVRWTDAHGSNIGFKRLALQQPSQGSVMVTYGNGSIATDCAHYADDIQNITNFDIYILEYPGYEDRPGTPTQASLFAAASEALQTLPANKPLYLVGESLGTGVASYLAGTFTNRIAGLVLISPFNSVADVAQYRYPLLPIRLLIEDPFESQDYLMNYHGKVGITVDGRDTVVPEKFGLRLYHGYAGPKKLWEYPNGGHCEIYVPHAKFWKEAVEFWQTN